jgi:hypothetical protein
VLVQSCSVPKAIEFFLDPPSDLPPAGSKLVETLEVAAIAFLAFETDMGWFFITSGQIQLEILALKGWS